MNSKIIALVEKELERSRAKHPVWPIDGVIAAAVVAEESGELIRAALQERYEGGSHDDVRAEAIQTIASCVRLLECR